MAHKHYTYQVMGNYPFPMDMLRYDRCYPVSGEDSANIERTLTERRREMVTIKLEGMCHPTEGRWSSFLWSVVRDSVEEYRPE